MSRISQLSRHTKKSLKKRVINAEEREEVVRKKLTEFYCLEVSQEAHLTNNFYTDTMTFLAAGAFGQVFHIVARRDISFADLEATTVALTADRHEYLNRVEPLQYQNKAETAIRRGTSVALKCETAFNFQLENFPVLKKSLPNADAERLSLYKEYNTLCSIFKRFGYKETRGFTKPYAFGRLGDDYTFVHFEGAAKSTLFGFHFLLLEMCGPDLEDMLEVCSHNCRQNDQRLSTRTVFLIGDQFISRLQCLQETSIGLSHNDLKCNQLLTGKGENTNTIYLIDYGLATQYKETWKSQSLVTPLGNRRWAPRSSHQMTARTPLCEIESACYVLLRLLKNHFPWDGMFDRQIAMLHEMKDKGEDDVTVKTGDQVLYEEKQFLWMHLKKMAGRKLIQLTDDIEQEIEKYKDFFEQRNDKWGDGGSQMRDLMVDMVKMGDPVYCSFIEKKIDYNDMNYMAIRRHLLGIFDLSMYAHCVESAALTGSAKLQADAFFRENLQRQNHRTDCGRPVYYYFPEGEQHCFWEWHCRCRDFYENRPEYWHKVLANREELADHLRRRQISDKASVTAQPNQAGRIMFEASP